MDFLVFGLCPSKTKAILIFVHVLEGYFNPAVVLIYKMVHICKQGDLMSLWKKSPKMYADFKNIFAKKSAKKLAFFTQNKAT
jgi:hypothetical protein